MGTWGHKVFESDLALDVKEAYLSAIKEGLDPVEATDRVCEEFSNELGDTDEHDVVWLALAETQWEYGRLIDSVRSEADAVIDKPIDEEYWGELAKKRDRELKRLARKIAKPLPKAKRIVRREPKFNEGDVFYFEAPDAPGYRLYGRHLTEYDHVFYRFTAANDARSVRASAAMTKILAEDPTASWREFPEFELEDILLMDVAFIGNCYEGIVSRKFRVIGNLPLEEKFKRPIYFYHRGVGSSVCNVFDIWNPNEYKEMYIEDVPPHVERWHTYSFEHILTRLGVS